MDIVRDRIKNPFYFNHILNLFIKKQFIKSNLIKSLI